MKIQSADCEVDSYDCMEMYPGSNVVNDGDGGYMNVSGLLLPENLLFCSRTHPGHLLLIGWILRKL